MPLFFFYLCLMIRYCITDIAAKAATPVLFLTVLALTAAFCDRHREVSELREKYENFQDSLKIQRKRHAAELRAKAVKLEAAAVHQDTTRSATNEWIKSNLNDENLGNYLIVHRDTLLRYCAD